MKVAIEYKSYFNPDAIELGEEYRKVDTFLMQIDNLGFIQSPANNGVYIPKDSIKFVKVVMNAPKT